MDNSFFSSSSLTRALKSKLEILWVEIFYFYKVFANCHLPR